VTPDDVSGVYLPDGEGFDFWRAEASDGGKSIVRETPIDECPVYVKAGTVLPLGPSVQYAQEKEWDDLIIRIYPGADGEFVLYEDAGDGYKYEKGEYTAIRMKWDDGSRKLTICGREGSYPEMLTNRIFRVVVVGDGMGLGLDNENYTVRVEYDGRQIDVKL
jgi:alpha-D-xyloside xylohydrolase